MGHEIAVEPVVDLYALGGYTGKAQENIFVISGTPQEVREKLSKIVVEGVPSQTSFSEEDELNFVVFRGVFNTGGYNLVIDEVEKIENKFVIRATYTDPGRGVMVTQAFTQPSAIILIGSLRAGTYNVGLLVTQVVRSAEGDKALYEEKERKTVEFTVG